MTGGLTASVGVGTSKFIAKVASDLDKPDGLVVVPPGTEMDLLRPMHVSVIPGVGPATTERLRRAGIHTVADLEASARTSWSACSAPPTATRSTTSATPATTGPVVAERETKSVSVEGTYDTDLTDRKLMAAPAHPAGPQRLRAAPRQRARRPHGHDQGAAPRLHHAQPLDDARLPHRRRRPPSAGSPSPCSRTSTRPAASACSASASPGWPTGSRRTCSARPSTTRSRRPPTSTSTPRRRPARRRPPTPGRPAWTSSTR